MEETTHSFLNTIPVFHQVLGVAAPLILSVLAYEKGIDLPVLIMFSCILGLFINFALAILLERRTTWRDVHGMDFFWALICGAIGAVQQNLSVISFGLVSPDTSSTVAIIVPIVLVFFDGLSSWLFILKEKKLSMGKGVAILIWSGAAIVSYPAIFQGPVIFRLPTTNINAPAPMPPMQHRSWITNIWNVALCFASSAPIATWITNTIKERTSPDYPYSFSLSTWNYFFGSIVAGIFAIRRDWNKEASELVSFTTLKVVEYIGVFISVVLTAGLTWRVQQKGPSYAAPFAYIYLVIEVVVVPLALDLKLHLRSVISVALLGCGILVYNYLGGEKEATVSTTANDDQGMKMATDNQVGEVGLEGIIVG